MIPWSRLEVARRGQGPAHAPVTGSPQMSGGGCSVGSRGGMALICVPVEDATVTRLSVGSQASVASCRADKAEYSRRVQMYPGRTTSEGSVVTKKNERPPQWFAFHPL